MSALTPRPGIMKIAPYVPGKDSIEGKETIAKLSSNEGALGPQPQGDGGLCQGGRPSCIAIPTAIPSKLRTAIGRHYGLDPASASSAARAPTSSSTCWCAPTAARATSCSTASTAS